MACKEKFSQLCSIIVVSLKCHNLKVNSPPLKKKKNNKRELACHTPKCAF